MPTQEPCVFGPFAVDSEGRLSPAHPDLSPGFSVRWRGRTVHARLSGAAHSGSGRLTLQAALGRVPSSASDPDARTRSFAVLRALERDLHRGWRLRLTADHRSRLETEMDLALPVTVACLVTELTAFLTDLSPYMDLLDHVGVVPPN